MKNKNIKTLNAKNFIEKLHYKKFDFRDMVIKYKSDEN